MSSVAKMIAKIEDQMEAETPQTTANPEHLRGNIRHAAIRSAQSAPLLTPTGR